MTTLNIHIKNEKESVVEAYRLDRYDNKQFNNALLLW